METTEIDHVMDPLNKAVWSELSGSGTCSTWCAVRSGCGVGSGRILIERRVRRDEVPRLGCGAVQGSPALWNCLSEYLDWIVGTGIIHSGPGLETSSPARVWPCSSGARRRLLPSPRYAATLSHRRRQPYKNSAQLQIWLQLLQWGWVTLGVFLPQLPG